MDELRSRVRKIREERNWTNEPKELAIDVSCEAAELLELFQWLPMQSPEEVKKNDKLMKRIRDELGDVFTSALKVAGALDLNPEEIINEVLDKMEKKYPVVSSKDNPPKKYE